MNWLNEMIGSAALADIKNEVVKQLVMKMKAAKLADKASVNYFQVVKAVVASATSSEGEQLYSLNWNFHFIGLPVVDEKKQRKPSLTASEVEQILGRAKGRYKGLAANFCVERAADERSSEASRRRAASILLRPPEPHPDVQYTKPRGWIQICCRQNYPR